MSNSSPLLFQESRDFGLCQGSHRHEKYLNLQSFLEKYWKNHSKALKSPRNLLYSVGLSTVYRELNHYKIVVPIFGAAYAAPNKATTILH